MKISSVYQEDVIGDLVDCVYKIQDDEIREFTDDVLGAIEDSPFWSQPASPSGKYHPPENNLECGLLIHTVKAFYVGESLLPFYGITRPIEGDIVRSAIVLHDIKKGFPFWKGTVPEHGLIAAEFLDTINFDGSDYVKEQIKQAIALHMSRWTYPARELAKATTPTLLDRIVQMSDYMSSRKDISFYPGKTILKEE